jgi:sec-independent protein translocase protein TatC
MPSGLRSSTATSPAGLARRPRKWLADTTAAFTPESYVSLVGLMMAAFGAGFLFPVLLVFLQLAGVLSYKQLLGWWRYATVVIAVIAAVITPSGDPISMLALGIPMFLLYWISVGIGWLVSRRRAKATAEPAVGTA